MKKLQGFRLPSVCITRAHFMQSVLAGLFIGLTFWATHTMHNELFVTSVGASTFIVFTFPHAQSSRIQPLIGGYGIGVVSGFIGFGVVFMLQNPLGIPMHIPMSAFAVFLSMFLMTALDFKHPPAAALAVAITVGDNPFLLGFAGMACIVALCVIKQLLYKYLKNI